MPGIIWLASYPKSGNTWLRAFIATYMRDPDQPLSINDLRYYAFGDGFLDAYQKLSGRDPTQMSMDDIRYWRPRVHHWIGSHPTDTVFVKTHNMVGLEGEVPLITPDVTAGAIYVVRNPLDIVDSYANHFVISHEEAVQDICTHDKLLPGTEGKKLPEYLGSWTQNVRTWTNAPGLKRHVMRYEDMRAKPGPTFRGLIKFLELPLIPKRLQKAIRFTSFKELSKQEEKESFNEARPDARSKFFRKGSVGGWRDILTDDQIERIVSMHADYMRQFGYLDKKGNPL